ncbi:sensor histidine kinase [Roseivirga sp. E12]|uniref:sensor histidine kinase n=1 Tax=Roseivirga sp. E12 TaxID=2819237 RepID=UPI001ABC7273|nr:histidine kinase [Roseivirga sp. E12]MBO3700416.1 histidine kinase [Roseivirga sp. E12]
MSKSTIYLLRIGIGLFVFLFFKLSSGHYYDWQPVTFVSLAYTVLVVLVVFEILDYTAKHLIKHYKTRLTEHKTLFKFYWGNCFVTAPVVIIASYIHTELLIPQFPCCADDWEPGLTTTIAQGLVLSWLIIMAKTFMIYFEYSRISEREKSLLQKELAQSKFESLKDQIKPHFLFNSFSVLTTIIEDDPKLAVEFVSKLSKIYRYVLDTGNQLVPLETELEYLDHYIFLLKARHGDSLIVNMELDIEADKSQIPILSMQMLIENALKHNYFSKENSLTIDIYSENNDYIVVRNNINKRSALEKPTKIGLNNINNRYQMLVNKSIDISQENGFFTVKLPLINKETVIQ